MSIQLDNMADRLDEMSGSSSQVVSWKIVSSCVSLKAIFKKKP